MKIELEEQEINLLKSIIARTEEQAEGVQNFEVPKGYILTEEPKSQRLQLLLKASTFQDLKKLSEETGESVNAICNRFFEKCLAEEERKGTK